MSADSEKFVTTNPSELNPQSVANYLLEHPDFFIEHEDVIEGLKLPHESGQAISLIQKQVSVLRENSENHKKKIQSLINNANVNDGLFEKTRLLILSLLKAKNLESLNQIITKDLSHHFDTIANHLIFIGQDQEALTGLPTRTMIEAEAKLGELFIRERTFCGRLDVERTTFFFGEQANEVKSVAIVPIHLHQEKNGETPELLPVLVTGSANENFFHSNQDTLFLDFIGEVLAALIIRFLK